MPGPQDLDAVVAATRRVIDLVRTVCESWRFPSNLNHATATACLARAADLVDEALYLAGRPPSAGANILVRSAFECWLVGAWALFGGDDALLGIEKERARNEFSLASSVGVGEPAVQHVERQKADIAALSKELLGTEVPSSVKYEQMAAALPRYIKHQTPDHEVVNVTEVYNLLYRSHSTYDAHPWKVIQHYLRNGGWRVEPPAPWQEPVISSGIMAMYIAVLGRWIEGARGRDGSQWNVAVADLERLLRGPSS